MNVEVTSEPISIVRSRLIFVFLMYIIFGRNFDIDIRELL